MTTHLNCVAMATTFGLETSSSATAASAPDFSSSSVVVLGVAAIAEFVLLTACAVYHDGAGGKLNATDEGFMARSGMGVGTATGHRSVRTILLYLRS